MVTITLAVCEDPRGHDLIQRPEKTMSCHGDRYVGAENSFFLTFPQHSLDQIKVFHQQVVRELAKELEAVSKLGLKHDGQIAFRAQSLKMKEGHAAQFLSGVRDVCQRGSRARDETMEGRVNRGHQQLIFVLEVKVDGSIGNAGAVCNLRHARVEEPMLGDYLNGGIQDALMLVRGAIYRIGSGCGAAFHV